MDPTCPRPSRAVTAGPRVAVLAAHPDDETIGAGALLGRLRAPVLIHVTDGVPADRRWWPTPLAGASPEAYAAVRAVELRAALDVGEVRAAAIHGLGARDGAVVAAAAELARALAALLREVRPATLLTHAYEGGHPDHDAAALIARAALTLLARGGQVPPRLVEMTSYRYGASAADGLQTRGFLPPPAPTASRELVHALTPAERDRKRAMLRAFASQAPVLQPFGVEEERFRRAPAAHFGAPPHAGALWYERQGFIAFQSWRAQALAGLGALGLDASAR